MFTGLVQAVGRIEGLVRKDEILSLTFGVGDLEGELAVGDSVAVAGVCLTATHVEPRRFRADLAEETQRRTTLGDVEPGGLVNLELPLRAADRLGGHFVQGHVDEVGDVRHAGPKEGNHIVRVRHAAAYDGLVVEKGSITIDGVSLTVTACSTDWLEVMLIPHTLEVTTLGKLSVGDRVNLEYDILAKYVARLAEPYMPGSERDV